MISASLPLPTSDHQFAFGLLSLDGFMPTLNELPAEFVDGSSPWVAAARHLFEHGTGQASVFTIRPELDLEVALRHLGALLRSPRATPQHRDAAVGFLLSQWFILVQLEAGPTVGRRPH